MNKKALITGCNGQDGSYLSELLLSKSYKVYGLIRRSSVDTTERIDHLKTNKSFELIEGEVICYWFVVRIFFNRHPRACRVIPRMSAAMLWLPFARFSAS